jgi:hypothetical protein
MSNELDEFSENFHTEIRSEAIVSDSLREVKFVEKVGEILEENGVLEAFTPCQYHKDDIKVDGYDSVSDDETITVVVSKFFDDCNIEKTQLKKSDVDKIFISLRKFFYASLTRGSDWIEMSNEANDLAENIYENRKKITKLNLLLITDGVAPKEPAKTEEFRGTYISQVVWDIERIYDFYKTGEREKIDVNFIEYYAKPLTYILLSGNDNKYSIYLMFMPGDLLASVYERWGIRILDLNVRVFLSSKGGVNKGLRKTIVEEPDLFCAFNNGVTAYAETVDIETYEGISSLRKAHDFQIINGGQTTASLYHAKVKDKADLSSIFVPFKLVVLHSNGNNYTLLNRISKYSNTQNKVQIADLAANEKPHPELQAISNKIMAPDPTGGSLQKYWFYERARGSYQEQLNMKVKTLSQKKKYEILTPKNQKFDKIMLGKVWNTYIEKPYLVSLGGQKNFARFNEWLVEQNDDLILFFKQTIALIILWKATERVVLKKKYSGYRHNIVTYSLSWLFFLTQSRIDLDMIWRNQKVGSNMCDALERISEIVNEHIRGTSQNVTEYCKKEACWNDLKNNNLNFDWSNIDEYNSYEADLSLSSQNLNEDKVIEFCIEKGYHAWDSLFKWLRKRDLFSPNARKQARTIAKTLKNGREPDKYLSTVCAKIWEDAKEKGWIYDTDYIK